MFGSENAQNLFSFYIISESLNDFLDLLGILSAEASVWQK